MYANSEVFIIKHLWICRLYIKWLSSLLSTLVAATFHYYKKVTLSIGIS